MRDRENLTFDRKLYTGGIDNPSIEKSTARNNRSANDFKYSEDNARVISEYAEQTNISRQDRDSFPIPWTGHRF